jgi:hypothetical protein
MWWARSRLLNLDVDASQADQWPGSFVCPSCARPVGLRRGPILPPYFAHRRGEGTADCENYHPPSRLRQAIGLDLTSSRSKSETRELPFLAIRGHAPREAELIVRIPKADSAVGWSGSILMDTGLGEMAISSLATEKGSWVSVSPLRHYAVTAAGEVDPYYASKFYDAPLALEPTGSLFRYGEGLQRQLSRVDQISWGTNYWLVGLADALQLSQAPAFLDIDVVDLRSPWVICLLTLPPSDRIAGDQGRLAERWLGRSIAIGRDVFSFVYPLPHHFDSDGTPIFEEDTATIRLRCPTDASLLVFNDAGERAEVEVHPLADEHEVHLGKPGNWRILLDGREAGWVRLENCLSLVPPRILLEVAGEAALLPSLESERLLEKAIVASESIQVTADLDSLRNLVTIDAAAWPNAGSLAWTVETAGRSSMHIDVHGVGAIGSAGAHSPRQRIVAPDLQAMANWLWSVSRPASAQGSPVRINLPRLPLPSVIRRLEGRRWHVRFGAHVRALQAKLRAGGHGDF